MLSRLPIGFPTMEPRRTFMSKSKANYHGVAMSSALPLLAQASAIKSRDADSSVGSPP